MGQTIICEYLANWEEISVPPDPKDYGFDGLYGMLEECQDTMLKLGTAANDGKRRIAELETALAAANAEIATLASLALDATNIFSYTEPDTTAQLSNCG